MPKELYHAVLSLPGGHRLEVEGTLKMREYLAWVEADATGNMITCFVFLARLIKSWDYKTEEPVDPAEPAKGTKERPLDPKNIADFSELNVQDYKVIAKSVSDWLKQDPAAKN